MALVPDPVAVWNARVKITAGFVNTLGLGLIGFAVLRPLTEDMTKVSWVTLWWWTIGLALHVISHYILKMVRKALV